MSTERAESQRYSGNQLQMRSVDSKVTDVDNHGGQYETTDG